MEFSIYKSDLTKLLKKVSNIFFSNIKFEKGIIFYIKNNFLYIISNNDNIEIRSKFLLKNKNKNGFIYLSYKKLFNICKYINKDTKIFCYKKNNFLILKTNKSIFCIKLYSFEKFNKFKLINYFIKVSLDKNNILTIIKNTYFSISNNEFKNCFNGMLFEFHKNKIITITTDGYRLSFSKMIINININKLNIILIHKKSVLELIKFLENEDNINIIIYLYKDFLMINTNESIFISKLLNYEFPNYDIIINKDYKYKILINKNDFKDSINRVSSILDNKLFLIKIEFYNNFVYIKSTNLNGEYSIEKIIIKYNGPLIEIGINYNYLKEIFTVLKNDNLLFKFLNSYSSIEILDENLDDKKYIIMPIKI